MEFKPKIMLCLALALCLGASLAPQSNAVFASSSLEIEVSISPDDDGEIPFGKLLDDYERRERITVTNVSDDPVDVGNVGLTVYYEDFVNFNINDPAWKPSHGNWSVTNDNEYRAGWYPGPVNIWMQSLYEGILWEDLALEVKLHRKGNNNPFAGIVVRASDTLSLEDNFAGKGYAWVINTLNTSARKSQFYRIEDELQDGQDFDPGEPGGATNALRIHIQGENIQGYINGERRFALEDTEISGSGRIGLVGRSQTDHRSANHYFESVAVWPPLGEEVLESDGFELEYLPQGLPITLDPNETFEFDVVFTPGSEGYRAALVNISTIDQITPNATEIDAADEVYTVKLSGEGAGANHWMLHVLAPDGEGATDPQPGYYVEDTATGIQVEATPDVDWTFSHWILDNDPNNTRSEIDPTFGPLADGETLQVQAVFTPPQWTLEIEPEGQGSTDLGAGSHQFSINDDATVVADPEAGWHLLRWEIGAERIWADTTVTVPAGSAGETKQLKAVFKEGAPRPDLYITRSADPETVNPGDVVEYTINYGNKGASEATGVIIRDVIPDGTEFEDASPGANHNPAARTIEWNVGAVAPGEEDEVWFRVQVDSGPTDGGPVTSDEYSIDSDQTEPIQGTPGTVTVTDTKPPTARMAIPDPDDLAGIVSVPPDPLVMIEVADGGTGVFLPAFHINIGDEETFWGGQIAVGGGADGDTWRIRWAGAPSAYRFYLTRNEPLPFGQEVAVVVNARDSVLPAGNSMPTATFNFRVRPRLFGEPKEVGTQPGAAGRPALAHDGAGRLFAAWEQDGRIQTAVLPPDAEEWVPFGAVPETGGAQSAPALGASPDGRTVVAAWTDTSGVQASVFAAVFVDGALASGPAMLNDEVALNGEPINATSPAVAVGTGEARWVAWQQRVGSGAWSVHAAHWAGGGWHAEAVSDSSHDQTDPALAAYEGAAYLVWTGTRGDYTDLLFAVKDGGWTLPGRVEGNGDADTSNQSLPALAIEPGQTPKFHLAWQDDRNGNEDVYYGFGDGTLQIAEAMNALDDAAEHHHAQRQPSVLAFGGRVFVAWQDGRGGTLDVHLAEMGTGGEAFGLDAAVKASPAAQSWPSLGVRNGVPAVLWREGEGAAANVFAAASMQPDWDQSGIAEADDGSVESAPDPSTGRPGISASGMEVDVDITVSEVLNPPDPPEGGIGVPWAFGPGGLTFDPPAIIEVPVTEDDLAGMTEPYTAHVYDALLEDWIPIAEAEHDPEAGVLRFDTSHFSMFALSGSQAGTPATGRGRASHSSIGCSMSAAGPAGMGDALLLLLPATAALALGLRKRRQSSN